MIFLFNVFKRGWNQINNCLSFWSIYLSSLFFKMVSSSFFTHLFFVIVNSKLGWYLQDDQVRSWYSEFCAISTEWLLTLFIKICVYLYEYHEPFVIGLDYNFFIMIKSVLLNVWLLMISLVNLLFKHNKFNRIDWSWLNVETSRCRTNITATFIITSWFMKNINELVNKLSNIWRNWFLYMKIRMWKLEKSHPYINKIIFRVD